MPITLSSQVARRVVLAGAGAVLGLATAGCGASFDAQTLQPYQAAEGTNAESGPIAVRNLMILASADGKGILHTAIVNNGSDDTLATIAAAEPTQPAAQPTPGAPEPTGPAETSGPTSVTLGNFRALPLKAGTSVTLPAPTGQPVTVTGGKPGQMVKLTLTFTKAAPITADVPVLTTDHFSPTPRDDGPKEEH